MARAKEIVYFGDRFDAQSLGDWGVLNQVAGPEHLDRLADEWTARCVSAPPLAVREAKRLLQADPGGREGAASQAAALFVNERLLRTQDFLEGLNAALEGRPPAFRGQ
jgi:enoyl-CoA hydratase/3-hydroxyacyl-CoA dehydrogenase